MSSTLTGGTELPEMQTLDRDLCDDCRDDGGGSRLRDFIHYCNVAEWDRELDAVEQLSVGASVQYRFRLPKINRSDPDDLRPHTTRNVRTWVSNNASCRKRLADNDAGLRRGREAVRPRSQCPHGVSTYPMMVSVTRLCAWGALLSPSTCLRLYVYAEGPD